MNWRISLGVSFAACMPLLTATHIDLVEDTTVLKWYYMHHLHNFRDKNTSAIQAL